MNIIFSQANFKPFIQSKILWILFSVGFLALFGGGVAVAAQPLSEDNKADVTVYKTEFCGCCTKWTDQLENSGLSVEVIIVDETSSVRSRLGVPQELASCHTAVAAGYWIEGHVPTDLVQQLITEQPADIKGIALPGMVPGSPGMETPNPSTYKVLSVDDDGNIATYAVRKGQSTN